MQNSSLYFNKIEDFLDFLEIPSLIHYDTSPNFSFFTTKHYAKKIQKGNPFDPLLLQILPQKQELEKHDQFIKDPVGDKAAVQKSGILKKYKSRALLLSTRACSLNCRFCFRRNLEHENYNELSSQLDQWLAQNTDIEELIFSGGDPFSLPTQSLKNLLDICKKHTHLKILRFHSRYPITDPQKLQSFLPLLSTLLKNHQGVFVSHVNHAQELDQASFEIFKNLQSMGYTLLNQSVLLKGINDQANSLIELSKKLFSQGVLPYYLHQLDKADGTSHFEVSDEKALQLHQKLMEALPGYLVPKLVREIAGEAHKTPLYSQI